MMVKSGKHGLNQDHVTDAIHSNNFGQFIYICFTICFCLDPAKPTVHRGRRRRDAQVPAHVCYVTEYVYTQV
jgi:hypothetical protein